MTAIQRRKDRPRFSKRDDATDDVFAVAAEVRIIMRKLRAVDTLAAEPEEAEAAVRRLTGRAVPALREAVRQAISVLRRLPAVWGEPILNSSIAQPVLKNRRESQPSEGTPLARDTALDGYVRQTLVSWGLRDKSLAAICRRLMWHVEAKDDALMRACWDQAKWPLISAIEQLRSDAILAVDTAVTLIAQRVGPEHRGLANWPLTKNAPAKPGPLLLRVGDEIAANLKAMSIAPVWEDYGVRKLGMQLLKFTSSAEYATLDVERRYEIQTLRRLLRAWLDGKERTPDDLRAQLVRILGALMSGSGPDVSQEPPAPPAQLASVRATEPGEKPPLAQPRPAEEPKRFVAHRRKTQPAPSIGRSPLPNG